MSKFSTAAMVAVTLFVASAAFAVDGPYFAQAPVIQPVPEAGTAPMAVPGDDPVAVQGEAVPLYHCVKYKDERHIAPCAVPMIVMVKDPCPDPCDKCNPCATSKCVAVKICVPPCSPCPPKVSCKKGGEYVTYDYGKYKVRITSRKGAVTVNYDS